MEGFVWAVAQIPQNHLDVSSRPERWSVARILYHMAHYEQRLAFPSMLQWCRGAKPVTKGQQEDALDEERTWNNGHDHELAALFATFKTVRSQQIELLPHFNEQDWHEERDAIWGSVPLVWVVTKTYQHTLEHTDEILKNYLWWR